MQVDFQKLAPVDRYRLMIQTIVPRPVAWALTLNDTGNYNLAPFSYFNAVHGAPPLFVISIGNKRDKSHKDTRRNIEKHKNFVVHIGSVEHAEVMTKSAMPLPENESEVELCGLETINDWDSFEIPRLKSAKIAFACKLDRVLEIGSNKQGLVFGEILHLYIDDKIASEKEGQILVDAMKLDPIARLGGNDYGALGRTLTIDRPDYRPN